MINEIAQFWINSLANYVFYSSSQHTLEKYELQCKSNSFVWVGKSGGGVVKTGGAPIFSACIAYINSKCNELQITINNYFITCQ